MRRRFMNSQSYDFNSYLTIEALEDEFSVSFTNDLQYSINGGRWDILQGGKSTPYVNVGDRISFKGKLIPVDGTGIGTFQIDKSCNLLGNCMSILYGEDLMYGSFNFLFKDCKGIKGVSKDFLPATTLAENCYFSMFEGCTSLVNAPELPATNLAQYCYESMFDGCTSLKEAPSLPATQLYESCYYNMFYGCTSLVNAPELPATVLAESCYRGMFYGCTSLVNAPKLPATTLTESCYYFMFIDCVKLNYIKMLATDISAKNCLYAWVEDVSPTGTFVKSKDATWNVVGISGVPRGWTVITDDQEGDSGSGLEFPIYLEYDSCEQVALLTVCTRAPDAMSLELYSYLFQTIKDNGELIDGYYYLFEQMLEMLGISIYVTDDKIREMFINAANGITLIATTSGSYHVLDTKGELTTEY